ncbi:MAG: UvrD-helicase domain-containing protein [Bacteroidetes bacterium]|nr:UvrD-helicase domain-containing protein [Bacteroidota bacterium]MDA0922388.1 UvrD-helicase domain-containing protein [Bacteroidota bacterium]MDA1288240.1 UvrD-helicase domain-containing protein [Bacteroidota bacterium]
MNKTGFHLIQASAGSGKTYTLVYRYLKFLLASTQPHPYRHMLALTFTNKAVNEMKSRILEQLWKLSNEAFKENEIRSELSKELSIESLEVQRRARIILRNLIAEYGSFDVITLDKFAHRIVRVFSKEFNLPPGFEVVTDATPLLQETVQSIIHDVGKDPFITSLLTEFSNEKVRQENSWDIQKELDQFAALLVNENDQIPLAEIQEKTPEDHLLDVELITREIKTCEQEIQNQVNSIVSLLTEMDLDLADFKRGLLKNHIEKLQQGKWEGLYKNKLELSLRGNEELYTKTTPSDKASKIDLIQPQLLAYYLKIKNAVGTIRLLQKTLKNWTPRVLLHSIEKRLIALQRDKEIQLLSGFNQKINTLVQGQDAPYIFERMGERYSHFFIDEFQDTSKLQWANLVPLIAHSIESEMHSGESGKLLLVGDPKQAIYRWRGGDLDQFVDLLQLKSPFQIQPDIENLSFNYRSGEEIVRFNNAFFKSVATHFESDFLKKVYGEDSQQKLKSYGGFVKLESIPETKTKPEGIPLYLEKTITAVAEVLEKGYLSNEIAILVRTKVQSDEMVSFLAENNIATLSSDALLVGKSLQVKVLLALLKLSIQPNDAEQHKIIFDAYWEQLNSSSEEYHKTLTEVLHLNTASFFTSLCSLGHMHFDWKASKELMLLDSLEHWIEHLPFINPSDPFVLSFLEEVSVFSAQNTMNTSAFLSHWNLSSSTIRLSMPEQMEAITVMTIHQAKGLEFPVVILPFLDTSLLPNKKTKVWFPFQEGHLSTIKWSWFTFSKDLMEYGARGNELYEKICSESAMDEVNVLYVAMTRAVEQLYVITQQTGPESSPSYAQLFANFINSIGKNWNDDGGITFGNPVRQAIREEPPQHKKLKIRDLLFRKSTSWKKQLVANQPLSLPSQKAQQYGLFLHEMMAKIKTAEDVEDAFQHEMKPYDLTPEEKQLIKEQCIKIVTHPLIEHLFNGSGAVFCEKEILIPKGETLRPDRINVFYENRKAAIVDYKTGTPRKEDQIQLLSYARAIESMNIDTIEKFILYINENITVQKIESL